MANIFQIKRRSASSPLSSALPTGLKNGELAFNDFDNTLFYGKGNVGCGLGFVCFFPCICGSI